MSGKPKYIQIEDSILNQIKGGDLRPGDQIPTEAELCDTFKVSRMTVNKAIQSLASKGYINACQDRYDQGQHQEGVTCNTRKQLRYDKGKGLLGSDCPAHTQDDEQYDNFILK